MAAERRRGGGPGKEKRPEHYCCLAPLQFLYRMRALLLTFPSLPLSSPELLILKMGLRGFKSFSNHTAEGSLWVSRSREASLTPVMFRHLGWRIMGNYFLASALPGSLACEISKVNSVSPPRPSFGLMGCLTIVKKKKKQFGTFLRMERIRQVSDISCGQMCFSVTELVAHFYTRWNT